MCHTGLLTACEQDQDGTTVSSWSRSQALRKPVWHIPLLCVQWRTPDDRHRNCPKHVEFYSKNKFEKLVHLDGFIIRIYHDARSSERQIPREIYWLRWGAHCLRHEGRWMLFSITNDHFDPISLEITIPLLPEH